MCLQVPSKATRLLPIVVVFLAATLPAFAQKAGQDLCTFVNPMIGTGGHGHTFPGAVWPFGMVQLSPDTRQDNSWDGCGGYYYTDTFIHGFSHTHLSGTGVSDWGDLLIMPTTEESEARTNAYKSKFSHATELATPGYYKVALAKHAISAELTCTPRVGVHKYEYPLGANKLIIVDLIHRDEVLDSEFEIMYPNKIRGYRKSNAWARNQAVYFEIEFDRDFQEIYFLDNDTINRHPYARGKQLKAVIRFGGKDPQVQCKVSISGVDNAGARQNLEAEAVHFDFEKYKAAALSAWQKQLSALQVSGGTVQSKTNFYTALYHACIHPSLYSDVDGRYRGMNNKIATLPAGQQYYNVFSLWDTYRGLHPLLTLIDTHLVSDLCRTIYLQAQAAKHLPVWELSNNETNCMIGYHAASVLWDAWQKGVRPISGDSLLQVMLSSANENTKAISSIKQYGYVRADDEAESVSKTLEYAYDDWCILQMIKTCASSAKDSIYQEELLRLQDDFTARSFAWVHVLDPQSKHVRPKYNATWMPKFSPYVVDNNFTEANSWQYSFYVPHHFTSFVRLHGGQDSMVRHLDNLFAAKPSTEGRDQADITGLIGQYAHGNEPSHHIAWLYHLLGRTDKVTERVHQVLNTMYTNTPDGLIGNEDCGQMSAWYVLASMGLYPICPGDGEYAVCTPLWDSVLVSNSGISTKLIKNSSPTYRSASLQHSTFTPNARLIIPEKSISIKFTNLAMPIAAAPAIVNATQLFSDSQKIEMICIDPQARIFYTIDDQEPRMYVTPFSIYKTCSINFYSGTADAQSKTQNAKFFALPKDVHVKLVSKYNRSYSGGGDAALIDGLEGTTEWRTGFWQGYQSQDFEANVNFDKAKNLTHLGARFLSDQRSWIFYPTKVSFYGSTDGTSFELMCEQNIAVPRQDDSNTIVNVNIPLPPMWQQRVIKSIKCKATNFGPLPSWHPGAGGDAFIFVDEILYQEKKKP
jgi:predicted alpha-1,2-mannosidase